MTLRSADRWKRRALVRRDRATFRSASALFQPCAAKRGIPDAPRLSPTLPRARVKRCAYLHVVISRCPASEIRADTIERDLPSNRTLVLRRCTNGRRKSANRAWNYDRTARYEENATQDERRTGRPEVNGRRTRTSLLEMNFFLGEKTPESLRVCDASNASTFRVPVA